MNRTVFISSVIRGFEAERAAAKDAVTRLHLRPVMAEDFGAQPLSPQAACLQGVRESDIYLGIYGERYGYIAPSSSLSATEEEYREAKRLGKPHLCLEQHGPKEPAQAEFLQRIKDYEKGNAFGFFDSIDTLKMEIVQALNGLLTNPGLKMLDAAAAETSFERLRWGTRSRNQNGTWLGVVLIPARQGLSFFDVLDFGRTELQHRLLQPALFGSPAVFSLTLGNDVAEEGDALVFTQQANQQVVSRLEIHPDGTLVFGTQLDRDGRGGFMSHMFLIDDAEVERRLTAFLAYANAHYQGLPSGELVSSLYLGTSLTGIEYKTFGRPASQTSGQISVRTRGVPDPLKAPATPMSISKADLSDPPALASRMAQHIARQFRTT